MIRRDIPLDGLADRTGTPAQRRDLRNRFLPELERLLARLDGPRPVDGDENLQVGARLLVHDGDVTYLSATVTAHEG
ncbi:hypothetical protein [Nitriliruptor alkaliphilus]|uniref:hypothetical protein n=1 Tax=Nitriliruptor alkaliphilus TaxID=427918 RepID=UPI000695BECA|nr:hypothetical protein [Nitriliruptor alkaliphilus]